MSREYREKFGDKRVSREEIRKMTSMVFPVDEEGRPDYVTEQGHMKECDVNYIIKKYDKTGLISHVNHVEAIYGDGSSMELMEAINLQKRARADFMELPSEIREKFDNDPVAFLAFMEDPTKIEESMEMGLRYRTRQDTPRDDKKPSEGDGSGK